jgi:minor extracellular serine protease Vpr
MLRVGIVLTVCLVASSLVAPAPVALSANTAVSPEREYVLAMCAVDEHSGVTDTPEAKTAHLLAARIAALGTKSADHPQPKVVCSTLFAGVSAWLTPEDVQTLLRQTPGLNAFPVETARLDELGGDLAPNIDSTGPLETHGQTAPSLALQSTVIRQPPARSRIRVGIIDTGIDYTNSALGGPDYPNDVVTGGYDLADNDNDPMDIDGHGTEVAGILLQTSGAAQGHLELRAYKVFSDGSKTADTSTVAAAIDMAVRDGCDVISMSMGVSATTNTAGTGDLLHLACDRAADAGVVVVAAAGNRGAQSGVCPEPVDSPADSPDVLAVGAIDGRLAQATLREPSGETLQASASLAEWSPELPQGPARVLFVADPSAVRGPVDPGVVLVVRRDTAPMKRTFALLAPLMPGAVVFVDEYQPESHASVSDVPGSLQVPCAVVALNKQAIEGLASNAYSTIQFDVTPATAFRLASFSSFGLTEEGYPKPDVVASGVAIGSTWTNNRLHVDSGTSMATPAVSAAVASLMMLRPGLTSSQYRSLIRQQATPLYLNGDSSTGLVDPLAQGTGVPDVDASVAARVVISWGAGCHDGAFAMNGTSVQEFAIRNVSELRTAVSFSYLSEVPVDPFAHVSFSPESVSLEAGEETTISVTLSVAATVASLGRIAGYVVARDTSSGVMSKLPMIEYDPDSERGSWLSAVYMPADVVYPDAGGSPETANFFFRLRAGRSARTAGGLMRQATADFLSADIVSGLPGVTATLFQQAAAQPGLYHLSWTGVDAGGGLVQLDGTYGLHLQLFSGDDSRRTYTVSDTQSVQFMVRNTRLPRAYIHLASPVTNSSAGSLTMQLDVRSPDEMSSIELLLDVQGATPVGVTSAGVAAKTSFSRDDNGHWRQTIVLPVPVPSGTDSVADLKLTFIPEKDVPSITVTLVSGLAQMRRSADKTRQILQTSPGRTNHTEFLSSVDCTGDGVVDAADWQAFVQAFGSQRGEPAYDSWCDFNDDGRVDLFDMARLALSADALGH